MTATWEVQTSPLPLNDLAVDAYMVWDKLTGQARHPNAKQSRHWPVMVEFNDANAVKGMTKWCSLAAKRAGKLRAAFAPSISRAGSSPIHTAILDSGMEPLLLEGVAKGVLKRFQLGAPCQYRAPASASVSEEQTRDDLPLHILGVIDDGCCFAHESFRTSAQSSRVVALWDQDPLATEGQRWKTLHQVGNAKPYRYGVELLQSDLTQVLQSSGLGESHEKALYASIGRAKWGSAGHTHGARVMHLLAGPLPKQLAGDPARPSPPLRDAATLPIIFVQLPLQTVADATGDSLGMHVVDGARYIVERARARATVRGGKNAAWSVTINISLGSIAGPHDGTSMAELALAELARDPNVTLVMAAGNTSGALQRVHAQRAIGQGTGPGRFLVRIPPGHGRDSFVELWLDTEIVGVDAYAVQVTSPGGRTTAGLKVGDLARLSEGSNPVQAAVIFARQVAQGRKGTMILLAVAPTANRPGQDRTLASPGFWTVDVSCDGKAKVDVHAWIERDDTIVGARRPQQARFERDISDPNNKSYVNDKFTLSNLANAKGVKVVGGYVRTTSRVAAYSANGPLRGSKTNMHPAFFAPSDHSQWLPGIAVPGFYSGTHAAISGTSGAAPQIARALAEGRELKEQPSQASDKRTGGSKVQPGQVLTVADLVPLKRAASGSPPLRRGVKWLAD